MLKQMLIVLVFPVFLYSQESGERNASRYLNDVPSDGQWRRFGTREIVPKGGTVNQLQLPAEQENLSVIFSYQGNRSLLVSRLIKQPEYWENILNDEEVKWLKTWQKHKDKTAKALLLMCDQDGVVYLATKQDLSPVGEIRQKNWFKKAVLPLLKGVGEHGLTAFPVHLLLGLFGI